MKKRYALNAKINALDKIDQNSGDLQSTSRQLSIPAKTLKKWRAIEPDLRDQFDQQQAREITRLQARMRLKLLQRANEILEYIDPDTLKDATLNQLHSALNTLLNHARKLKEESQELDQEQTIRFEYYYDDQVQETPPWSSPNPEQPRSLQSGRLRPPLGQDRTGLKPHSPQRPPEKETLLVVDPNQTDERASLARLEKQYQTLERKQNQRNRTPH